MKQWLQITMDLHNFSPNIREVIIFMISEKCGGVEILEEDGGKSIRGYIPFGDQGRLIHAEIRRELTRIVENNNIDIENPDKYLSLKTIEDVDWATAWKKFYTPTRIGRHFLIVPTWESPTNVLPDDKIITLDPGRAFGTGHHESTRLCLRLLETLDLQEKLVADVGCGSGILAIAASKLSAGKIFACDIDEQAVDIARKNARQNEVGHRLEIIHGSEEDLRQGRLFDVVLANMLFNILQNIGESLTDITRNGGHMIWSGIVKKQAANAESLCRELNVKIVQTLAENEWIGLLLQKQ